MKYDETFLKMVNINRVVRAQDAMVSAFTWAASPQGYDSWWNAFRALREIEAAARVVQGRED